VIDRAIATAVVVAITLLSLTRYQRLNSGYDQSRVAVCSDVSFRFVYKIVVSLSAVVALLSFWRRWPGLLQLHDESSLRVLGAAISVIGIIGFESAVRALGSHYSPCFDLRVPTGRVTSGPYRYVAHPIYISNTVVLGGVFISSGSLWVFLALVVVAVYYWRSAIKEQRLLDERA
jgi:protein-S-isoprenylcysteine O-methyltransferase Ste14